MCCGMYGKHLHRDAFMFITESLPNTASSFTLRFHPGYGYAIDDAATIMMVKSSVGNAVFTRSPSPFTDPHYSTSSFDSATDSKGWTSGTSDYRLQSAGKSLNIILIQLPYFMKQMG